MGFNLKLNLPLYEKIGIKFGEKRQNRNLLFRIFGQGVSERRPTGGASVVQVAKRKTLNL